jgi:choline dehydrogenase
VDYDHWASVVGDSRWSYEGQLPWMKKAERWLSKETNPEQHGFDGYMHMSNLVSTGRRYPLTDAIGAAWDEEQMEVKPLPGFDGNTGDNLGRAYVTEAWKDGMRQWSASVYPLDGVEIMTDTLVQKIVLEHGNGDDAVVARGVELPDGTIVRSNSVICCAGAFRSPQLLMLSGIGPADHLKEHGVQAVVNLPAVGQELTDHLAFFQHWRLRDPDAGYVMGSSNPLFQQPEFNLGQPTDWIVSTTVPKDGLAKAIEKDEGSAPDVDRHPLLSSPRTFIETVTMHVKMPGPGITMDAAHMSTAIFSLMPTSRGSVSLSSNKAADFPVVDLNYLATEVDRYVFRQALRQTAKLMLGTAFGREYIEGESVPAPLEPASLDDDDDKLDSRVRMAASCGWHASSTCAMGKVVDTEFRVYGVQGLRVVDASVLPVAISAHIQAPTYAMAEQAAALIAGKS